jgi:hypothetical protein
MFILTLKSLLLKLHIKYLAEKILFVGVSIICHNQLAEKNQALALEQLYRED